MATGISFGKASCGLRVAFVPAEPWSIPNGISGPVRSPSESQSPSSRIRLTRFRGPTSGLQVPTTAKMPPERGRRRKPWAPTPSALSKALLSFRGRRGGSRSSARVKSPSSTTTRITQQRFGPVSRHFERGIQSGESSWSFSRTFTAGPETFSPSLLPHFPKPISSFSLTSIPHARIHSQESVQLEFWNRSRDRPAMCRVDSCFLGWCDLGSGRAMSSWGWGRATSTPLRPNF